MEADFIVYETSEAELYKADGRQVLECLDDGSYFVLQETLGQGSFSKVKHAERHWQGPEGQALKADYALKVMHKGVLKRQRCVIYDRNNLMKMTNNWEKIEMEIAIWRTLCHENIIRLYEIINVEALEHVYLVIEYADGGQIMKWDSQAQKYSLNPLIVSHIKEKYSAIFNVYPEREALAKIIFKQVALGLQFLHSKFVIHKDIKPDNILFLTKDCACKLTDFTISEQLEGRNALCYNPLGTTPFQAPESMLSGVGFVGEKADVWALGICVFAFMNDGALPFWEPESEIFTQMAIQNKPVAFPESFSNEVKEFLGGVLEKDPERRISLEQILTHPWLVNV
jgi:calcium/calmodulin-dependent protein kinase kinase 2